MENGTFDFNLFLRESRETLLNPKSYFTNLKLTGGIAEPLIKAVIYGALAGLISLIWGVLNLGIVMPSLIGTAVGFKAVLGAILSSVVGLFIGAVLLLVVSSICKGNTDFEANLRVTASMMVFLPVSYLFQVLSGIRLYLGLVVSLIIGLYTLWVLYNGIVAALKGQAASAKIVCYVLAVFIVLSSVMTMRTRHKVEMILHPELTEKTVEGE
ncbi:MAG: Yip1 family protein [Bacteroidales bacterium]